MSSCPETANSRVTFIYPAGERATTAAYEFCARHSWPWRAGRGNGTTEVEWT